MKNHFITENDKKDLPTTVDEQPDSEMNKTEAIATPSTSIKRRQSEDIHINKTNEDYLPKKKRESAIRSENNLKILIQNKQVKCHKHTFSPQKVLSLRKEARTETLKTLISAGKFDKLEKLYSRTVAPESHGLTESVDTISTDDSDSNNESETFPLPDINRPVPQDVPKLTNTTKKRNPSLQSDINSERSESPLREAIDSDPTEISSTNNMDQNIETNTCFKNHSSLNAEVSALQSLIRNLAPAIDGAKELSEADIKQLECIYNTILDVKRKLNAVYQEKSIQLKKTFESIRLFLPELRKNLPLPTSQQSKETSQPENPSEPPEASSQPAESPTSSRSSSNCSYVAKWMLQHQGPGSGLTELMPNSGIYVSEAELTRSKFRATEMRQLARLLLPLIFTDEALSKCSYTGSGPSGKRSKSEDTRPGLDEHARNTMMAFLNKHSKQCGWTIVSPEAMNQILRDKLRINLRRNYYLFDL